MPTPLHSYPWYMDDWLLSRSRAEMSLPERGLYRDVLDLCYRDGSVPDDPQLLCRMIGADRREFDAAWPAVRQRLIECEGGLSHPRVQAELPDLYRLKEVRRQGAAKAARARWDRPASQNDRSDDAQRDAQSNAERNALRNASGNPSRNAERNADLCPASASASASVGGALAPRILEPGKPPEEFFEERYRVHPKKGHRQAAERALSQIEGIDTAEVQRTFAAGHDAWLGSEGWQWKGGAKAPFFDEFILDRTYEYQPPTSADTQPSARPETASHRETADGFGDFEPMGRPLSEVMRGS